MEQDHIDRIVEAWVRRDLDLDPGLGVKPLEITGRLRRCASHLQRAVEAVLRPLGLSYGEFDVMSTLRRRDDPGGTHPKLLAASALISSGTMTSRLDRLERAGLITRHPDSSDRRAIRVRLTPKGEAIAAKALEAVHDADRRFLEPLTQDEQAAVAASLRRLLLHHDLT